MDKVVATYLSSDPWDTEKPCVVWHIGPVKSSRNGEFWVQR